MEFRKENEELSFVDRQFEHEPHINVIEKEMLNKRIETVFGILYETLVKSFGPGGAGAFISNYPRYYHTKDGFTIMKNLAFDIKLDQVICDIVMDICSRLNFTVGDGTTSAVIATKTIYEAYIKNKYKFDNLKVLPRDIISRLAVIRDEVIRRLNEKAVSIRSDDPDVLADNIRNVVRISSNGNEELTEMISNMYRELKYPAITVSLAKDGIMKSKIISGFNIDITLTDKIYINNDNDSMVMNGANVIIFDHKVTQTTYESIIKPLNTQCKNRMMHLICIAPYYDEVALGGVIRNDLLMEHHKEKNVNLVLTVCKRPDGASKVRLEDLAMLLHTRMITVQTETDMVSALASGKADILDIFNLDNRDIEGLMVAYPVDDSHLKLFPWTKDNSNIPSIPLPYKNEVKDTALRVGYADNIEIGLKESVFSGFYYDEHEYNQYVRLAKSELAEIQKKVETIGTFSFDLVAKQERLYALGLKTGIIEVGASSEISQNYLKDIVDDAVKAAASAYTHGVVLGCNVTLDTILMEMAEDENCDVLDTLLIEILLDGFFKTYRSVMGNVFNDSMLLDNSLKLIDIGVFNNPGGLEEIREEFTEKLKNSTPFKDIEIDPVPFKRVVEEIQPTTIHGLLIGLSVMNHEVLDVSTGKFTKNIINSSETDKEILKAIIDLLALFITGNQMVIC